MLSENRSGQQIKSYELLELIGKGGFAQVYRAMQPTVGREVAVKIIMPLYANLPEFTTRFESEVQVIARLEHPHIVPLYDYWSDSIEGTYIVMRWFRGGTLRTPLERGGLPLQQVYRVFHQITAALVIAHQNGIVHRDLKPDNILLDEQGNAYLGDFGIAKDITQFNNNANSPNRIIGSPFYLAPEQIRADEITPRTDIYNLGLLLYELLTGKRPFDTGVIMDLLESHLNVPVPLMVLDSDLVAAALNPIVQKATAKNPADRYTDVASMVFNFQQAVEAVPEVKTQVFDSERRLAVLLHNDPAETLQLALNEGTGGAGTGALKAKIYKNAQLITAKPRRLIGRDEVLAQVQPILANSEPILLHGLGGMGKTSLAATLAANFIEGEPGKVIWLEVGRAKAETVLETLAAGLSEGQTLPLKSETDYRQVIGELLLNERTLLVLDNAWDDQALFEVMSVIPQSIPVIITSRHVIPIDGELVDVLELNPNDALTLLEYHARQNYRKDKNAPELCQRLGYHPFALEMAGKHLKVHKHLTPAELTHKLQESPHDLQVPGHYGARGRQSIKDLMQESVNELDLIAHKTFVTIGGFYAPFATIDLLARALQKEPSEVEKTLIELEQRGLLELQPAQDALPSHYHLHDLTYSYARAMFQQRHISRKVIIDAVQSFATQNAEQLDLLDFEQLNILGAVKEAHQLRLDEATVAIMEALVMQGYLAARGHSAYFRERLNEAIQAARWLGKSTLTLPQDADETMVFSDESSEPLTSGTERLHYLLGKRGNIQYDLGKLKEALADYHEALQIARELDNKGREVILLCVISKVRTDQGEADAGEYLEKARAIAVEPPDDFLLSYVLENQGYHAQAKGDYSAAREFFGLEVEIAKRLDDPYTLLLSLSNLGTAEGMLEQYADALAHLQEALTIAREMDNHLSIAEALESIGQIYLKSGDRQLAHHHLAEAKTIFDQSGIHNRVQAIEGILQADVSNELIIKANMEAHLETIESESTHE